MKVRQTKAKKLKLVIEYIIFPFSVLECEKVRTVLFISSHYQLDKKGNFTLTRSEFKPTNFIYIWTKYFASYNKNLCFQFVAETATTTRVGTSINFDEKYRDSICEIRNSHDNVVRGNLFLITYF